MPNINAVLFIDTPPICRWLGDRMEFEVKTGDLSYRRVLSRHAAVGLFMALKQALAESEGIAPLDLCDHFERLQMGR